ncbi:hypothetical protein [Spirillospora sp. NPDC029432]|uniref:hypothetical protein n=1 Tax=Spirillospora sp. NPDC029432 TaxID=3154599 RepID=UPI003451CACA
MVGALGATDAERADGWYSYPLVGRRQVEVRLAHDVGTRVVCVRFGEPFDARLREPIGLLLSVFARYEVAPGVE